VCMGKTSVTDFDQAVCNGDVEGETGPCPERVGGGESTGRGGIDRLARVETEAIEAVTGDEQFKCGLCGCPLVNLEAFGVAPENCPRIEKHDRV